jgi:hypothetical protein
MVVESFYLLVEAPNSVYDGLWGFAPARVQCFSAVYKNKRLY